MSRGRRLDRISVFAGLLLSYTALLLLPLVLMGSICFFWVSAITRERSEARCVDAIYLMDDMMRDTFEVFDSFSTSLSSKPWVRTLSIPNYPNDPLKNLSNQTLLYFNELKSYKSLNGNIFDICIYFTTRDKVISEKGIDDFNWFFSNTYAFAHAGPEHWAALFSDGENKPETGFMPPEDVSLYRSPHRLGVYYRELSFYANRSVYALIMIDEQKLTDMLELARISEGTTVRLLDAQGNLVAAVGEDVHEPVPDIRVDVAAGEIGSAIIGDKYVFTLESRYTTGMYRYIVTVPKANLQKDARIVMYTTAAIVMVLFLVGLVLCSKLAKRDYKPLHAMLDIVNAPAEKRMYRFGEVAALDKKIMDLKRDSERYRELTICDGFRSLLAKLDGHADNAIFQRFLESEFTGGMNAVAIFAGEIAPVPQRILSTDACKVCLLPQDHELIGIFNFTGVVNFDDEIRGFHQQHYPDAAVKSGRAYPLRNIWISYNEARKSYQNAEPVRVELHEGAEPLTDTLFSQAGSDLAACMDRDAPVEAAACIQALLQQMIRQAEDAQSVRHYIRCKAACKKLDAAMLTQADIASVCDALAQAANAQQALDAICALMTEKTAGHESLYMSELSQSMMKFVHDHFCDPDLSLSAIAEKYNMTVSYVSKVFKELIGENFLEYVAALRVQQAVALFDQGETGVQNVGRQVGYENPLTFRRAFKKRMHMLPNEYLAR